VTIAIFVTGIAAIGTKRRLLVCDGLSASGQLRRRGTSLRDIAEETSLGLRTVRTILDQQDGGDRTTIK
jgi:hypothetical protein